MSVGLVSIIYGLTAGWLGYMLGLEVQHKREQHKRPKMSEVMERYREAKELWGGRR